MTTSIQIGARLRAARIAAGFKSVRDLVTKLGIPTTTYTQHESGARGIDSDTIKTYCDLLHINETWLLTGQGRVFQDNLETKPQIPERELAYVQEMNKLAESQVLHQVLDIDFLSEIIASLMEIHGQSKNELPLKEIIQNAFNIYCDISTNTPDKTIRSVLLKTALNAYRLMQQR